jgi:hypothetical protein
MRVQAHNYGQRGEVVSVGMRRRARTRGAVTTAAVAAMMTAALAVGCTQSGGAGDDERGEKPSQRQSGTAVAPPGSVLAVKIDNARSARPHTGLDAADLVYAEQVEGGLSRLMAVYGTQLPEAVGPVRSARESDLELLRQFDEPVLAFSGAQTKLLPLIDRAPLEAQPPGKVSGAYYRGTDKPAPHNLYVRPHRLLSEAPGADGLAKTGFRFSDGTPEGGTAEKSRTVRYPAARFTFTWSAGQDRWLVSMDGEPAVTSDGTRVTAGTVVVQHVNVRESDFRDFLGNNTPYTETVGSGAAEVLRDGRVYDVGWERGSATDGTRFTKGDGTPMAFQTEGQVWVVFAAS